MGVEVVPGIECWDALKNDESPTLEAPDYGVGKVIGDTSTNRVGGVGREVFVNALGGVIAALGTRAAGLS